VNAANGGARVLIGRGGYCASVENDDFGFGGTTGARQAAIEQLALNGRAISLGRAASEVLHMVGRHRMIILSANLRLSFASCAAWV
jgi:hypothetical protein